MSGIDRTFAEAVWSGRGLAVQRTWSHYVRAGWTAPFATGAFGLVLPSAGAFRRRAEGVTQFVDAGVGFFRRPGEEVAVAHPTGAPDAATMIDVDPERFGLPDADDWPSGALLVRPEVDLRHRLLRRDLDRGADPWLVELRLADLVDLCLHRHRGQARRLPAATARRHHDLVAEACELLATTGARYSLVELARGVGCSPFHLSRLFKAITGVTLSQYRQSRRVHQVLDRIEAGEGNLSRIASDTGFADHSHMTRTVGAHLGSCPSRLRELLGRHDAGDPDDPDADDA